METQTQQIDPNYLAAMGGMKRHQDENLVRFQLQMNEELEELKYNLMGYEENEETGEWQESDKKLKMVSEQGANMIMAFVAPYTSKIFSLSNQTEDAINKRCQEFANEFMIFLCRHKHDFKIQSYAIMTNIEIMVDNMFYATQMKSFEGWEGNGLRKQFSIIESKDTVISRNDQKPNFFSNPFQQKQ